MKKNAALASLLASIQILLRTLEISALRKLCAIKLDKQFLRWKICPNFVCMPNFPYNSISCTFAHDFDCAFLFYSIPWLFSLIHTDTIYEAVTAALWSSLTASWRRLSPQYLPRCWCWCLWCLRPWHILCQAWKQGKSFACKFGQLEQQHLQLFNVGIVFCLGFVSIFAGFVPGQSDYFRQE